MIKTNKLKRTSIVLLAVLTLIITSVPPTVSETIVGRITDAKTNQPIAGATISCLNAGRETISDSVGNFGLTNLFAGPNLVGVYHPKYFGSRAIRIEVKADGETRMDFELTKLEKLEFADWSESPLNSPQRGYIEDIEYKRGVTIGIGIAIQEFEHGIPTLYDGDNDFQYRLRNGLPNIAVCICEISSEEMGICDGHNWYIWKMRGRGVLDVFLRDRWEDIVNSPKQYFMSVADSLRTVIQVPSGWSRNVNSEKAISFIQDNVDPESDTPMPVIRTVVSPQPIVVNTEVFGLGFSMLHPDSDSTLTLVWGPRGSDLLFIRDYKGYSVLDLRINELLNYERDTSTFTN